MICIGAPKVRHFNNRRIPMPALRASDFLDDAYHTLRRWLLNAAPSALFALSVLLDDVPVHHHGLGAIAGVKRDVVLRIARYHLHTAGNFLFLLDTFRPVGEEPF